MKKEIKTIVIDAGGRYGIHPSWKTFDGELEYYLFEPDIDEAKRLKKKYKYKKEVIVDNRALDDQSSFLELNILSNKAMSTTFSRSSKSEYFDGEKRSQTKIIEKRKVKTITLNDFCKNKTIKPDFLKLDVEGGEFKILKGSSEQLNNILGIRCEVNFDKTFENSPVFSRIHDMMLENDFFLLNLDYDGKGSYRNEFVKINEKFGILRDCDAVWIKKYEKLFDKKIKNLDVRILKYAAFCINNNASDVAIEVLTKGINQYNINLKRLNKTNLYKFIDKAVHKLFYKLKWQPGQSLTKHKKVYFQIFGKKMLETHDYNQSLTMNPD
jgi:FkbM family methyltransferase